MQIGPKIRVGGTVGKIGQNVKNAVTKGAVDAGHAVGTVASNPLVEGAAGLFGGPLAGAAVGGLGHLMAPGGNIGSAAKGAVTGGAAGLAGSALGKALPLAGAAILGHGGDSGTSGGGGYDDPGSMGGYDDPSGGASSGGGIDWGSFAGGLTDALKGGASAVASWVKAHPQDIMTVLAAYRGMQRDNKADAFAQEGLDLSKSEYNDPNGKGALRAAGTAGMLNPRAGTPDISGLQHLAGPQSGNPFTKALPMAPLNHPAGAPGTALPLAPGAPQPLPLTGLQGLPLAQQPGPLPPGGSTGLPPTIPTGMKPPAGWTPPKALPLASDPNAVKLPYAN